MTARALAACLLLATTLASSAEVEAGGIGFAPSGVGLEDRRGESVPLDATFRDLRGAPVRLGAVLGRHRPALLVLAYNRCAMLCNLVLRGVADRLRDLELAPGRDFDLVTISIDPRDSGAELTRVRQAALARAGYENQLDRWQFLTGEQSQIARVAASVGFRYRWDPRTEQFAHPAAVIVLSGEGQVRHYLEGLDWTRAQLLSALRDERAAEPVTTAAIRSLIQCFRPDTANSRYGRIVRTGLQAGAALVLGALLLVIVRVRRTRTERER